MKCYDCGTFASKIMKQNNKVLYRCPRCSALLIYYEETGKVEFYNFVRMYLVS